MVFRGPVSTATVSRTWVSEITLQEQTITAKSPRQIRISLTYCSATIFSGIPDRCRQLESYLCDAAGCELLAGEHPIHRKQDLNQRPGIHIALHGEGRPVRLSQCLGERQA